MIFLSGLYFAVIVLSALLIIGNGLTGVRHAKSVIHDDINYKDVPGRHGGIQFPRYSETSSSSIKDIDIRFKMKVRMFSDHDNIFQTAPENKGIRMEFTRHGLLMLIVGGKTLFGTGVYNIASIMPGRLYAIEMKIDRDNNLTAFLDGRKILDGIPNDDFGYQINDIIVGRGYDQERIFHGEISDFSIRYNLYDRIPMFPSLCRLYSAIFPLMIVLALATMILLLSLMLPASITGGYRGFLERKLGGNYNRIVALLLSGIVVFLFTYSFTHMLGNTSFSDIINLSSLLYLVVIAVVLLMYNISNRMNKKNEYVIMIVIPLVIIVCGKLYALLTLAFLFAASFAFGMYLLKKAIPGIDTAERIVEKSVIALFVGLTVNGIIIWAAMHFRINYQWVYIVFYSMQIIVFRQSILNAAARIKLLNGSWQISRGMMLILLFMIVNVVYPLVPFYLFDELVTYFYMPKFVAMHHYFDFSPHYPPGMHHAVVPFGIYTSLYLIGNEFALRLFVYFTYFISFIMLERYAYHEFGERTSFLTVIAFIFTPFLLWDIASFYLDVFGFFSSTVLLVSSLYCFKNINRRNVIALFALFAFAYFNRMQAAFLVVPIGICLCVLVWQKNRKEHEGGLLASPFVGFFMFLLLLSPFLIISYVTSNNPFFPFFNNIFKSEYMMRNSNSFGVGASPIVSFSALYDITFHGNNRYYYLFAGPYAFGFFYFIFGYLSPIFLFIKKNSKFIFIFVLFILGFVLFYTIQPQMRYFNSIMPVGALVIGYTMAGVFEYLDDSRILKTLLAILIVCICVMNFSVQIDGRIRGFGGMIDAFIARPYPVREAFTHEYSGSNIYKWNDLKRFFNYASAKFGPDSKALMHYSPALYLADFHIRVADHYNYSLAKDIVGTKTPRQTYDLLFNKYKFDFIILTMPDFFDLKGAGLIREDFSYKGYTLYVPNE
ncbi:MAG: hypothetical protein JXA20_09885 [Spirochaetes bacterium]|nr:hypothetical protein [Spirochaetota bacterium]